MKPFLLVIVLLIPCAAAAQTVSLGLIGGVPITDAYETADFDSGPGAGLTQITYASRAKRYTIGPAVEVSLPFGLAVEFDALYKRVDYNFSSSLSTPSSLGIRTERDHNIVSRWDFPFLMKYKIRRFRSYTPYFGGGLNTNYIANTTVVTQGGFAFTGGGPPVLGASFKRRVTPPEFKYGSSEGLVIGGGLRFRYDRLRIAPELRYTRWAHENFRELTVGTLRSNLNQSEILFTLGW